MKPCKIELENLLDKTIVEFGLRELLTARGISSQDLVRLDLSSEGESIVSCDIQLGEDYSIENSEKALDFSSGELREDIKNFFNRGLEENELVEKIEQSKADGAIFKVTLSIGKTLAGKIEIPKSEVSFYYLTESPCTEYRARCCTI